MDSLIESLKPLAELGFAGLCIALLGFIFWATKQGIEIIKGRMKARDAHDAAVVGSNTEQTKALVENTVALKSLGGELTELRRETQDVLKLNRGIKDNLLQRPCMIPR